MPEPIIISIATGRIDKAHLVEKNGKHYLNFVLWPNKEGVDKYGNEYCATQSVSKEARESGVKGPIIGNGKIMKRSGTSTAKQSSSAETPENDEVPF